LIKSGLEPPLNQRPFRIQPDTYRNEGLLLNQVRKIIALVILLCILFMSSGQTYEQQSIVPDLEQLLSSKPLESLLTKLEIPYWGIKVSIEERGYYAFIEFLIRKSAHFFTFGLIAFAIYAVLPKWNFRILTATFITFLVAVTDETHQSLTAGRTASFQDVMVDMMGAVTVLSLLRFSMHIKTKKSAKEL
jgi:VanZ family protein